MHFTLALALAIALAAQLAFPPTADAADSRDAGLNDYLHSQRLPLVQAQITRDARGRREVVVYGFTATDLGKKHAAQRVAEYLHDPRVKVENRIQVKPELANFGSTANSTTSSVPTDSSSTSVGNPSLGNAASYSNNTTSGPTAPADANGTVNKPAQDPQLGTAQQYQQQAAQQNNRQGPQSFMGQGQSAFGGSSPLTMLLMAAMGMSGGSSGMGGFFGGNQMGGGFGASPYGSSPYYGAYGSPYGPSPYYSNPYGPNPYGPDPYGQSPYGANPYSPDPYGPPPGYGYPGYP